MWDEGFVIGVNPTKGVKNQKEALLAVWGEVFMQNISLG
jgi:hypothetical protein